MSTEGNSLDFYNLNVLSPKYETFRKVLPSTMKNF